MFTILGYIKVHTLFWVPNEGFTHQKLMFLFERRMEICPGMHRIQVDSQWICWVRVYIQDATAHRWFVLSVVAFASKDALAVVFGLHSCYVWDPENTQNNSCDKQDSRAGCWSGKPQRGIFYGFLRSPLLGSSDSKLMDLFNAVLIFCCILLLSTPGDLG